MTCLRAGQQSNHVEITLKDKKYSFSQKKYRLTQEDHPL
jgi:hypothetical protein